MPVMRLLKQYIPGKSLLDNRCLKIFGPVLHSPYLWHLNRRSASSAFANGLFWACIPIPSQMVAAAVCSIFMRANLPLSVALVWLTNPLTMIPAFYFNYLVGSWLLGVELPERDFEPTVQWFSNSISHIWQPLFAGSVLVGLVAGSLGYISIRLLWRLHLVRRIKARKQHRLRQKELNEVFAKQRNGRLPDGISDPSAVPDPGHE
ncbi:MAG: DUF2062 domain-containing protein [gamma proteobacterium symbiont of Bathyaustriella thionipta]|nr:DUF2062 domain-containing protein [gamma proteobacterium symbiont of Bathyaustriella thionipta]